METAKADKLIVRIVFEPGCQPTYATNAAAGADLYAHIAEPMKIAAGTYCTIPTGVRIELPVGYEGQVRSRSGLARNFGISVLNSPGTIDADYRGQIYVLLVNYSKVEYTVNPKDRVAQLVIAPVTQATFESATQLLRTKRDTRGFGSTGK